MSECAGAWSQLHQRTPELRAPWAHYLQTNRGDRPNHHMPAQEGGGYMEISSCDIGIPHSLDFYNKLRRESPFLLSPVFLFFREENWQGIF